MTSVTNAEVKHIKSLHTKKGRKNSGKFLAEGVRLLEEAVTSGVLPEKLYVAESLLSDRGRNLVARMTSRKVPVTAVPAQKLESMAGTRSPQGLLALFSRPGLSLSEHYRTDYRRVLWCENINDPGNLGTLLRSAAAFGFNLVCLTGECAEPFGPKVVRSSAGQIFRLRMAATTFEEMIKFKSSGPFRLLATSSRGETDPALMQQAVPNHGIIVAVGAESDGLSAEIIQAGDLIMRIDHVTSVESLNVAVAGSIMMKMVYDIQEQIV